LDFNDTNGSDPVGSLILSGNNYGYKLYGMAVSGGKYKVGCIFSIDTNGNGYNDLHDFNDTNGEAPFGDLTLSGSILYGMTAAGGGLNSSGVIFSIDTNGTGFTVLYNFKGYDSGAMPYGSLILNNNKLYGMTEYGGRYGNSDNDGNIFSINTNGSGYKDMYDFFGYPFDGQNPTGSLILSGGKLYGMTQGDIPLSFGNIFSIDTNGSDYTTMFFFHDTNGGGPLGSLILIGNNLYGMTSVGGTVFGGVIFKIDTNYVNTTSINELTVSQGAINVYPNPASTSFTVSLPQAVPARLEMYNELGERVITNYELKITASTINVSNLPEGVYFYRVVKEDGSLIGEGKEVIIR
jgi:uncharacterized repeat protein (TIGR03803 family)